MEAFVIQICGLITVGVLSGVLAAWRFVKRNIDAQEQQRQTGASKIANQIAELSLALEAREAGNKALEARLDAQEQSYTSQIEDITSKNTRKIEALEQQIKELPALQSKVADYAEKIITLQENVDTLTIDNASLKKSVQQLSLELAKKEAENHSLKWVIEQVTTTFSNSVSLQFERDQTAIKVKPELAVSDAGNMEPTN